MPTSADLLVRKRIRESSLGVEDIELIFNHMKDHGTKDNCDSLRPVDALDLLQASRVESPRKKKKKRSTYGTKTEFFACPNCKKTLHPEDHTCSNCALVIEESPLVPPSRDEMRYKIQTHHVPCMYKRQNHWNERLCQVQGKQKTHIPAEVIDQIKAEINKTTSVDIKTIDIAGIRKILKKLKLSKYYEHVNYLTHMINGYQLPYLTQKEEDKLRNMFNRIQGPFDRNLPSGRSNFLNYNYVFRKCLELLELDELLPYFSNLKSREKLYEQDKIWKIICDEINWQFIPSL
tara:strand:+ start:4712 stop:5581 length:870 start_codon:yes stop_codon:yes gene_type:complete